MLLLGKSPLFVSLMYFEGKMAMARASRCASDSQAIGLASYSIMRLEIKAYRRSSICVWERMRRDTAWGTSCVRPKPAHCEVSKYSEGCNDQYVRCGVHTNRNTWMEAITDGKRNESPNMRLD